MKTRKVVYWVNQEVTETFTWNDVSGWTICPRAERENWPSSTFDYYEINATDDQFLKRLNGCVIY